MFLATKDIQNIFQKTADFVVHLGMTQKSRGWEGWRWGIGGRAIMLF